MTARGFASYASTGGSNVTTAMSFPFAFALAVQALEIRHRYIRP
jgi:hypothetical protein